MAMLFAVPALLIAVATYRDQQRVTEAQLRSTDAQLESTRLDRQRYDSRYAARVTYWDVTEKPGGYPTLKVQNRSPVPVMRIQFTMAAQFAGRPFGPYRFGANVTAPPCSVLTLRLVKSVKCLEQPPEFDWVVGMDFLDTVGWWHVEAMESPNFGAVRAPERLETGPGQEPNRRSTAPDPPQIPKGDLDALKYRYGIMPEGVELRAVEVPGTREAAGDCGESS
ncbi:hypothetical protein [Micromonospora sp. DPT]|uniref:hypothetical protein n=1 Tax=Micromonospora sp. DPT TaxID=3142975 RepID=UPI0032099F3E